MDTSRQCKAKSKQSGQRCKRRPIPGGFVCVMHGGKVPQVKAAAEKRQRDMLAEALDPNRALEEMACLAFSDIREAYDADGRLLPTNKWPDSLARAVAATKTKTGNIDKGDGKMDEVVELKLWDKGRALENALKKHGLLTERVEVSGDAEMLALLDEGRRRVAEARKK